ESFSSEDLQNLKSLISPELLYNASDKQIRNNYRVNFFQMPVEAEEMIADRIEIKEDEEFYKHCQIVSNSLIGLINDPIFIRLSEVLNPTLIFFGKNDLLIPNRIIHNSTPEEIARIGTSQIRN